MKTLTKSHYKKFLLGGAMALAMGATPLVAHATPYAFASDAITGLSLTTSSGPITIASGTTPTTNINNNAIYGSYAFANTQNQGVVGAALTAPQAYSGPGPAPATSFSPIGAGAFTGTRADASIGAGTASTGVSVSNVAEGYGGMSGNSNGKNTAAIDFTVTGTGSTVHLAFTDAVNMIASLHYARGLASIA
jgi:hypothetical protein